jgi:hypothetical protein
MAMYNLRSGPINCVNEKLYHFPATLSAMFGDDDKELPTKTVKFLKEAYQNQSDAFFIQRGLES